MSVTWHGLNEFLSDLRGFADRVDRLPEHREAGDVVADDMRSRAPYDTGQLAGSVQVVRDGESVAVFPSADHAAPIIVGVPSHNIEPHPFPEAALSAAEGEVMALLERGVEREAARI